MPGRMQKSSQQWTDEQRAYLRAYARRHGQESIAAAARMIVQAEMERSPLRSCDPGDDADVEQ